MRQPLSELKVIIPEYSVEGLSELEDLILDELNVKRLTILNDDGDLIELRAQPNFRALGPRFGKEVNRAAEIIRSLPEDHVKALEKGEEIEADGMRFGKDDIVIERSAPVNYGVSETEGLTVALNLELTQELIDEGRARELVHQIQNQRREAGLEVTDRINIKYSTDPELERAVNKHLEWIKMETLAVNVVSNSGLGTTEKTIKVDGFEVNLVIEKNTAI